MPQPHQRKVDRQGKQPRDRGSRGGVPYPRQEEPQAGDHGEEYPPVFRTVIQCVVQKYEKFRSASGKRADLVERIGRQVVENAQAEQEVGKVVPERKRLQVAKEVEDIVCGTKVAASDEDRFREVHQDELAARSPEEMAPPPDAASQVADPFPRESSNVDQVEVLGKFFPVFRKHRREAAPLLPEGVLDVPGELRWDGRPP